MSLNEFTRESRRDWMWETPKLESWHAPMTWGCFGKAPIPVDRAVDVNCDACNDTFEDEALVTQGNHFSVKSIEWPFQSTFQLLFCLSTP